AGWRRQSRAGGGKAPPAHENRATGQPAPEGCTLAQYAEAKKLPIPFLRECGVENARNLGRLALRIPYRDLKGQEAAVQFRLSLAGEDRFRWKKGSRPMLYGLWRLPEMRKTGYIVLVEGPSDCHTLWLHKEPALGLPSATGWREEWAPLLGEIPL